MRISDWSSDVCSSDLIAEVAVHRIDRLLALDDARTEPADIGVDAQAIDRLELRRQLGAPHLRIEILVARRAIPNLSALIIAVIIEERGSVQRLTHAHQHILGADLEGIDKFPI